MLSKLTVTFIDPKGGRQDCAADPGLSVLEVAQKYGISALEGACSGSMACSTCHVIVDPAWVDRFDEPSEDEEDMLDLAFGLTRTSRLGCQLILKPEHDGLLLKLPAGSNNMMSR